MTPLCGHCGKHLKSYKTGARIFFTETQSMASGDVLQCPCTKTTIIDGMSRHYPGERKDAYCVISPDGLEWI